jgi:REP element-mobilizing transposase RayT
MSTGYHIANQGSVYFVTFQVVEWIDIFSRKIYRDIVLESLRYCQKNKGLEIFAFVIMTNHVHLLVRSSIGKMSDTVREFKSFTARQILDKIVESPQESCKDWMLNLFEFAAKKHKHSEKYQFWIHENHAEEIITNIFFDQKINYYFIENNYIERFFLRCYYFLPERTNHVRK